MSGYENNGANNSGSNPYNYIGSEHHVRALQHDMWRDRLDAEQAANNAYRRGWDSAVAEASKIIHRANNTIDTAGNELIQLRATVAEQAARIAQLEATVKDADEAIETWIVYSGKLKNALVERTEELAQSKNEVNTLNNMIGNLTAANDHLTSQIDALLEQRANDERADTKTLRRYSNAITLLNCFTEVIDTTLSTGGALANNLRDNFQETYPHHIKENIENGTLDHWPHQDPMLINEHPAIQRLIMQLAHSPRDNDSLLLDGYENDTPAAKPQA